MEQLAILGGSPIRSADYPKWPQYDQQERQALVEVLESEAWWRTPGTRTLAFEQAFAAFQNAKHAIACTNGTAAIEIALSALGIGLGDEVIVPNYTFVATASAVLLNGALPVMVDIDPATYNIDPAKVEAAITQRTKAIIAVHIAGYPAEMETLQAIAKKHNLYLLEDCAHAHGAERDGQKVGTFGQAGTFSFQQSKLITAGEGGIILTNDDDLEVMIRSVHDCGRMPGAWFYAHFINGSNYRLSEWQSAILSQQLERFEPQAKTRSANAVYLNQHLAQVEGVTVQAYDPNRIRHGHYCYIFTYEPECFSGIPAYVFTEALDAEGIPTSTSYPPLHNLALFSSGVYRKRLLPEHAEEHKPYQDEDFPVTIRAAERTIWLEHRSLLGTQADADDIVRAIRKIQEQAHTLV